MARPRSHLVQALREIVLARGDAGATWRDLAQALAGRGLINVAARAEVRLVRKTAENMAARGELQRLGQVQVPGSRRPMVAWVAGVQGPMQHELALADVMRCWNAPVQAPTTTTQG
jgi:hypothetical protein